MENATDVPSYAPRKGVTATEIDATIDAILAEATLAEKCAMMAGRDFLRRWQESGATWGGHPYLCGGGLDRLGVPALYFTDGPRGVARGQSTCFPCTMARGASFDVELERRIGEAMGIEARAQECTLSGAVCMNLLRHPAWGRAQETYGEDPHHVGAMATALGLGIQTHNVVATLKHFALNSMENARFKIDVRIDPRTLREVYLPHFKAAIDAGIASVMSAYNRMNGEFCGQNRVLLTDILRHEWGFDGFVHSDWIKGVYQLYGASAGLDVEMPEPIVFKDLPEAVADGRIEPDVIDRACRRILRVLYRFAGAEDPLPTYPMALIAGDVHQALAREAAEKSAVLLTNDGTLPLDRNAIGTVAVLGRLADLVNTGDKGSSSVRAPYVVTPLAGLRDYLGNNATVLTGDEDDLPAATAAARTADVAIVVVGLTADDEGEFIEGDITLGAATGSTTGLSDRGGDRDSLDLPPAQVALIEAALASGTPVIVVIVAGSAILCERWIERPAAVLQTFYAGMEGGAALARLLFGDVSPSARLPFTVARDAADYPYFDKNADTIEYGPYHGYTLLDRDAKTPRFGFGHGLSYARFDYRALKVRHTGDRITAQVSLTNSGPCAAREIVQVYVGFPGSLVDRPQRLLRAFTVVTLDPGERRTVSLEIVPDTLRYYDVEARVWRIEPGEHRFEVGGASADLPLRAAIRL